MTENLVRATALAHPNIALIKYWGNRDEDLRLPANGSLSMNLAGLETRTSVCFTSRLAADQVHINGSPADEKGRARVSRFLDEVRRLAGLEWPAEVESSSNFPAGAGIASSAAAFAALALSASTAAGLDLDEPALSRLARHGSGSACRSVPQGFVEWLAGSRDQDSYAVSIAPPDHWDLVDCLAVISSEHKATGSTEGHSLASTSPLQSARVMDAPRRLELCRRALLARDFESLATIVEQDSDMLHAVMMTSQPGLFYWQPASLAVMQAVREARRGGLPACYTVDAGPNVHVLTLSSHADKVGELERANAGVREVRVCPVGGKAHLVTA